jgi:hypothetical protein
MDCCVGNKAMNRTLLFLFALLVIGIASLNVLQATQVDQGKPVLVTPMRPMISGQRMPFTTAVVFGINFGWWCVTATFG